jgi:peptide/nickel transport system permease protein
MSQYVLRRLLIAVPSLLGISLVLFTVLALAPGDPFSELATNPNVPPEVGLALRAKFGLDDPIYLRYLHWLSAMLHGDWGFSFVSRMNVDTLILQRLPTTLYVIGSAQLLALLLDWLPFVYTTDIKATGIHWVLEQIRQAIMPVMVLGLFQAASMTRFVRSAMLDVVRLDYVTTARAKGLGQATVIVKHVMRNAMIPVVTLIALQMPAVFGGAIVTEQIFRIPGIGSLLISSILSNDTPVVMAVTFVFACLVVLFNLIADVLYGWLDPRISFR